MLSTVPSTTGDKILKTSALFLKVVSEGWPLGGRTGKHESRGSERKQERKVRPETARSCRVCRSRTTGATEEVFQRSSISQRWASLAFLGCRSCLGERESSASLLQDQDY